MNDIITGIFCIILFYILVFIGYKGIQNKRGIDPVKHADKDYSCEILNMTGSNNNYDPLLDVLLGLDGDLSNLGITLHADMRGYLDYAERE